MTVTRPPRTDAHRQRDALVQQFHDAGLTPVLSCNGSAPSADIQVVKGEKPGELVDCWLTDRGKVRLGRGTFHSREIALDPVEFQQRLATKFAETIEKLAKD
jgi:hypothetical protein